MRYQCPKCKERRLSVVVEVWATLNQSEDGPGFETEPYGDHEWSETSVMSCHECDFVGEAHEFDTGKGEEQ